ncbi:type I restriction endonuclease subunit M [Bacillus cereus]|nr:type I restriction endonuclease subunit M [Bacillus cereus]
MVFTAHAPHEDSNKKTWFGYWRNDGYVKTKHKGRIDLRGNWAAIRNSWIEAYRNRDEIPGLAVKKQVDHTDEWCAEAYLETDYSTLSAKDFEEEVRKYVVYRMINEIDVSTEDEGKEEIDDAEIE